MSTARSKEVGAPRPVVALDTETTGLHWGREAWEIAVVKRWPDGNVKDSCWMLDVDLRRADPKALALSGFYERHPRGIMLSSGRRSQPTAVSSAAVVAERVAHWTHGATVVGANPAFDTFVLERLLHQQGIAPAWHYRLVDVEALAAGHLGRPPASLVDTATALGIPFPENQQHTALGDARMALAIYDLVLGGASC